jgi:NACalpha-BTF3-like transcription factor
MGLNVERLKKQLSGSAAAIAKAVPNTRLDHITKVTFETDDGRTFTFFSARVWKLNLAGNFAYQIRGDYPDLETVLPKIPISDPGVPAKEVKSKELKTE